MRLAVGAAGTEGHGQVRAGHGGTKPSWDPPPWSWSPLVFLSIFCSWEQQPGHTSLLYGPRRAGGAGAAPHSLFCFAGSAQTSTAEQSPSWGLALPHPKGFAMRTQDLSLISHRAPQSSPTPPKYGFGGTRSVPLSWDIPLPAKGHSTTFLGRPPGEAASPIWGVKKSLPLVTEKA